MRLRQLRPAAFDGVVDLPREVRGVLTREPGDRLAITALGILAMTGSAAIGIELGASLHVNALSHAARAISLELAHVPGNVCDVLQLGNDFVAGGDAFHAHVPARAAPEMHDLVDHHAIVLAGNARNRPIRLAATGRSMAGGTLREQLAPVLRVGLEREHLLDLTARGRLGQRQQRQAQQQRPIDSILHEGTPGAMTPSSCRKMRRPPAEADSVPNARDEGTQLAIVDRRVAQFGLGEAHGGDGLPLHELFHRRNHFLRRGVARGREERHVIARCRELISGRP